MIDPEVDEARFADAQRIVKIAALRWNVVVSTLYVAGWGTLNVGFPAYAERVHAGAAASGYMWAAISLGSVSSAIVSCGAV